jgi:CubicO group peptidase (beta-lactamase class C family)
MGQEINGMKWQYNVATVVDSIQNNYGVPGMIIAVKREDHPTEYLALGTDARNNSLSPDSLVPVASITKLATALTALRLADAGKLKLDDPLARYLPEAAAAQEGVTLRRLLSHTGGVPFDIAPDSIPYNSQLDWPVLAQGCLETPLATAPQVQVLYSNLGPGLLAIAIEQLTGQPFHETLNEQVLQPLHIEGYLGVEPPRQPAAIAGALGEHAGTSLEPYNTPFWRALALPWGGLVTDADGALALVRAFAGEPHGFLAHETAFDAVHDQTDGLAGGFFEPLWWSSSPWGMGLELRGEKQPHWTPLQASSESYGHAGASGCLVWHDPLAGLTWAVLGTRTFEHWWTQWPAIGTAILNTPG